VLTSITCLILLENHWPFWPMISFYFIQVNLMFHLIKTHWSFWQRWLIVCSIWLYVQLTNNEIDQIIFNIHVLKKMKFIQNVYVMNFWKDSPFYAIQKSITFFNWGFPNNFFAFMFSLLEYIIYWIQSLTTQRQEYEQQEVLKFVKTNV